MSNFAGRTIHGIPRLALRHAENPVLAIGGLVENPQALRPEDLSSLPRHSWLGSVSCLERGPIPDTDWTGMRLSDLIALANPRARARYALVSAGPYGVAVPIDEADEVLICDQLSGHPLDVTEGGPWRLVVPNRRYYTSVKWIDRIELTLDADQESAERIGLARQRAREAKRGA
ncbi:MAG: molybdopterin-dependent oxidoreductase [Thermomicrobiales bacterium]|nr:molybdopterin-dependent oxidoreductase [Thermomicrobiales bacterium]